MGQSKKVVSSLLDGDGADDGTYWDMWKGSLGNDGKDEQRGLAKERALRGEIENVSGNTGLPCV